MLVAFIFGKDFYDVSELADKCVDYFFGGRFGLLKGILPIIHNVLPKKSGSPRKFSAKQKCFGAGHSSAQVGPQSTVQGIALWFVELTITDKCEKEKIYQYTLY